MPRKKSYLTVTDQFCGAGGSSQGAVKAGAEVRMAMNHWKLAIETHNTNFPETDHDCADMSAVDPRRYPSTDILITSPECTNHSLAKGVKATKKQIDLFSSGKADPAAERSRATMWDVPRFAEYHNYRAIIVENVVDARKWVMFESWLHAMHALGYDHRCVYLNSMHFHPTPQSRDRMYVVFWKKGNRPPALDFAPIAHCPKCGKDVHAVQTWKRADIRFGKYRQQYVYCCPVDGTMVEPYYFASFNCIDWSDLGTKIGDRPRELSPNTRRRIEYGLKKYGSKPLFINDQHTTGVSCRVRSSDERLDTVTTTPHLKVVTPFLIKQEHQGGDKHIARSVLEETQTQTTRQSMALITPEKMDAFLTYYNGKALQPRHISEEIGSVTTRDRHSLVAYKIPKIEECHYRMLKAAEIKLAMAFNRDYVVLGSSRDQVKQLGNAVTPPAMEWLVGQVIKTFRA